MRADNRGEGGILALLALLRPTNEPTRRSGDGSCSCSALFGTALLYGDGVITPAISVLSRGGGRGAGGAGGRAAGSCRSPS